MNDGEDGGSRKLLQVQTVRYFCKFYINNDTI